MTLALALAIIVFLTITIAVFAFASAVATPSSMLGARLRSLGWQKQAEAEKPRIKQRIQVVLDPLSKALPLSPSEASKTRVLLMQAGYREPRHITYYFASRLIGALLGLAVAAVVAGGTDSFLSFVIGGIGLGFLLPQFVLKQKIKARQRRIRLGLADALDLTVICVDAGLSLEQALSRVGEDLHHAHPDLSGELHLVNLEMRAGKPRPEALRNLAERTAVEDIKALVGVLIQTDRFGTSVTQALRVHSDSLRTERRQRAEEQAAKTTIKMVPALVVFVLPSLFFVTLGPAVIQLLRILLPSQ